MSSQATNERHTFTVKDVNVQEYLEGKENKSEFLRGLLRSQVYGDPGQPDGISEAVWDTYMAVLSLFGKDRHFEIDAVVSAVSADQNNPGEVVRRRIKRCVAVGLMEKHTGISRVTVAAKPQTEATEREVVGDE